MFASLIANLAPKTYVPKNGKSGTYIANLQLWEFTDFFKKTYNKGNFIRIIFPITVQDGTQLAPSWHLILKISTN